MAGKRNEEKASYGGALRCAHEVQLSRCVNRFNRVSRLPRQGRGRSRDHRVHAAASSNDRLRVFQVTNAHFDTRRSDAVTVRGAAVESQEVPWQDALADQAAPFEIPVAALPLVVEDAPALRHGGPPAEMQAEQWGFRRLDANRHAASVRFGLDGDAGAVPSVAFAGERKWAAFEEGDGERGQAQDIDIAVNGALGLRISAGRQPSREGQQIAAGEDWWVHESIVSENGVRKRGQ